MSKNQQVAAIDIGTSKIVAIVGQRDDKGKIEILGHGEAHASGVSRGSVKNVGEVSAAIKSAVKRCQSAAGIQFQKVFVGISGQNIRTIVSSHTKYINGSIITQNDVDLLLDDVYNLNKEVGEEIIHVIPQSYSVDNNPIGLNPVGCTGRRLDGKFYVILGSEHSIDAIKKALEMINLGIIKIIYQPIASADAVLSNEDKEIGALVCDIGAGTTDVTIYHDKVLRTTTSIPFGGNSITKDIKQACQLIARQAEIMKTKYASAIVKSSDAKKIIEVTTNGRANKEISLMDLATITSSRMDEILSGVAYILQQSGYANKISEIVITGGGSKLANLSQLVKYRLSREVRIGKPRDLRHDDAICNEKFSASYGLFIKGFEYLDSYEKQQKTIVEEGKDNTSQNKNIQNETNNTNKNDNQEKKKEENSFMGFIKKFRNKLFEDPENNM